MNIEDKYDEIKNILYGCNNINNAKLLLNIYINKNHEAKNLSISLTNGKAYYEQYSYDEFFEIMKKIKACEYRDSCMNIIKELYPFKNINELQIKTLMSIIDKKPYDKKICQNQKNNLKHTDYIDYINFKKCPHCNEEYNGNNTIIYAICGYKDIHNGYNWTGCQKDWCYKCGKKLCKSWNEDKLYLEPNRLHNSECCKKYALLNNENYDNYCMCSNKYVNRNKKN